MKKTQALHSFWAGFGIPAYQESSVPDGKSTPTFPYITYQNAADFFGNKLALSASVWDRDSSWGVAEEKTAEISEKITSGGVLIPYDGGVLWITRGSPFSQSAPTDPSDDMIKRKLINITAEFISEN